MREDVRVTEAGLPWMTRGMPGEKRRAKERNHEKKVM
jgi:hypothetical protein